MDEKYFGWIMNNNNNNKKILRQCKQINTSHNREKKTFNPSTNSHRRSDGKMSNSSTSPDRRFQSYHISLTLQLPRRSHSYVKILFNKYSDIVFSSSDKNEYCVCSCSAVCFSLAGWRLIFVPSCVYFLGYTEKSRWTLVSTRPESVFEMQNCSLFVRLGNVPSMFFRARNKTNSLSFLRGKKISAKRQ